MQDSRANLDRRAFLRLGATGLAAAGSASLLPQLVAEQDPEQGPVVLRSSSLDVHLNAVNGLPLEYRLARSGVRFTGEDAGTALNVRLCRREHWGFAGVDVRPSGSKISGQSADFHFNAMYAPDAAAADFTLRYAVEGSTVRVTLEDIHEHDGFELISISMPSLVSVAEQDPATRGWRMGMQAATTFCCATPRLASWD